MQSKQRHAVAVPILETDRPPKHGGQRGVSAAQHRGMKTMKTTTMTTATMTTATKTTTTRTMTATTIATTTTSRESVGLVVKAEEIAEKW